MNFVFHIYILFQCNLLEIMQGEKAKSKNKSQNRWSTIQNVQDIT